MKHNFAPFPAVFTARPLPLIAFFGYPACHSVIMGSLDKVESGWRAKFVSLPDDHTFAPPKKHLDSHKYQKALTGLVKYSHFEKWTLKVPSVICICVDCDALFATDSPVNIKETIGACFLLTGSETCDVAPI